MTLATLLTGITVFGPAHLYDPFNTMLPALALLCVFVLAWRLACGDGAMLPWAILAGSLCVQTHVVYALAVLLTVGWAAVVAVGPRRWRPPGTTRPSNRCLAVSGGLTLVLWSAPLLDALRHHGGNLWLLARGTSGAPVVGPKGAVAAALHLANLPPVQFANISDSTFLRGANLSVVATTALGAWLAWRGIRSRDPILRRLLLVALGAAIAALATTSLLPDEPLKGGQMTFFKVVTPFVWLALVGCGVETWHIAPARRRRS